MTPPDKPETPPKDVHTYSPESSSTSSEDATGFKLHSDVKAEDYAKIFKDMYQSAADSTWGKKAFDQFAWAGQELSEMFQNFDLFDSAESTAADRSLAGKSKQEVALGAAATAIADSILNSGSMYPADSKDHRAWEDQLATQFPTNADRTKLAEAVNERLTSAYNKRLAELTEQTGSEDEAKALLKGSSFDAEVGYNDGSVIPKSATFNIFPRGSEHSIFTKKEQINIENEKQPEPEMPERLKKQAGELAPLLEDGTFGSAADQEKLIAAFKNSEEPDNLAAAISQQLEANGSNYQLIYARTRSGGSSLELYKLGKDSFGTDSFKRLESLEIKPSVDILQRRQQSVPAGSDQNGTSTQPAQSGSEQGLSGVVPEASGARQESSDVAEANLESAVEETSDAQVLTAAQLGAKLDKAYQAALAANGGELSSTMMDNPELKESLERSIQDAFQRGGVAGLNQFMNDLNSSIPTPGFGPLVEHNGKYLLGNEQNLEHFADLKDDSTVKVVITGPLIDRRVNPVATAMEVRLGGAAADAKRDVSESSDTTDDGRDSSEAPIMSGAQLGAELEKAYQAALAANGGKLTPTMLDNIPELKESLARSVQDAFQRGGAAEVRQLMHDINTNIPTKGFGPMVEFNGTHLVYNEGTIGAFADVKDDSQVNIVFGGPEKEDGKVNHIATPMQIRIGGEEREKGSSASGVDGIESGDSSADRLIHTDLPKDPNATVMPSTYLGAAALKELEEERPGSVWTAETGDGQEIASTQNLISELGRLPEGMVNSIGSKSVAKVNEWLRAHGSPLELQGGGSDALYAAAIAKVEGRWGGQEAGSITLPDGTEHPAFALDGTPKFYDVPGQDSPLVELYQDPETGFKVYAIEDSQPRPGLDGSEYARQLLQAKQLNENTDFKGIKVPKMNYNVVGDLDQFKAVHNQFGDRIEQAKYNLEFRMDQKGFSAESGLAVATTRGSSPPRYVLGASGKPIRIIIQPAGTTYPIMTFAVSSEHWNDPKAE